jgi:2-dehydropantoate 2-reductase
MRVLCVGAGAVGGVVASRLVRAGVDLCVFDANAEHVALLKDPGLVVGDIEDEHPTKLDARTSVPDGAFDIALLAVRSHHTSDALGSIGATLAPLTDVVSLQNGLNEDVIASTIGPERTVGCVVGFGSTWIEPGRIELNAEGDLRIGRLDGTTDERLERARDLLALAFPTRITDNVRGALWAKMLVNSMTVLGALGGMLTGDVISTRARRRVVARIVAEGVRVAVAEGVRLPKVFGLVEPKIVDAAEWDSQLDAALERIRPAVGAIKSVTWRDLEIGRPTEIDAVTGEIVRRGEERGVPTPLSANVYRALKRIEAGELKPEPANLDSIAT